MHAPIVPRLYPSGTDVCLSIARCAVTSNSNAVLGLPRRFIVTNLTHFNARCMLSLQASSGCQQRPCTNSMQEDHVQSRRRSPEDGHWYGTFNATGGRSTWRDIQRFGHPDYWHFMIAHGYASKVWRPVHNQCWQEERSREHIAHQCSAAGKRVFCSHVVCCKQVGKLAYEDHIGALVVVRETFR